MRIAGVKVKPLGLVLLVGVLMLVAFGLTQIYSKYKEPINSMVGQSNSSGSTETIKSSDYAADQPAAKKSSKELPTPRAVNKSQSVVKGVCLLGPSGLFLYVIETDGASHRLIKKELRKELIHEGFIPQPEEFKKGLQVYIDEMFNKGVTNKKYIQFITSSGAMKYPEIQSAVKSLEQAGFVVTKTSAEEEGRYALNALLSKEQRANSFLIDLTPTITRLSWYVDGEKTKTVALPGTKYYQDGTTTDEQVKADIVEKLKELPAKNRENGYIIWAAGEELKQGDSRYAFLADSYKTENKHMLSGLNIMYTVQSQVGTPLVFDWESSFPIGYVMQIK